MYLIGSDDGIYRLSAGADSPEDPTRVAATGRVKRVRTFDGVAGVFAATETGLYHSPAGRDWTRLGVPEKSVYAVGATPNGERLFAGTRPAHLYVTSIEGDLDSGPDLSWTELEGFRELPSRADWGLPRHDNIAQVRDVGVHPEAPDRVVAGVEVGGVHVSEDGGETWVERSAGVNDDVHELHLVGPEEFLAATGFGLFRTRDAGRTWTRLDEGHEQRYFRTVGSVDGEVWAGGALANSSTWNDPDADPALFRVTDRGAIRPVEHPRPSETITGLTAVEDRLVAATHGGTVLVRDVEDWTVAGSFPVSDDVTGRYTPLVRFDP